MPENTLEPVAHFFGDTPSGNRFEADLFHLGGKRYGSGINWKRQPTSGDMAHFAQMERAAIANHRGAPVGTSKAVSMQGGSLAMLQNFLSTGVVPAELN